MPRHLYHAGTSARSLTSVWDEAGTEWIPPFLLCDNRFFSFYDLEARANPLSRLLQGGDAETLDIKDFSSGLEGARRLVQLLNLTLEAHLYQRGLFVDKKRKRAYFPKEEEDPRVITYQARLRKATRTVVKARLSPRTEKVLYWEHQAFSYGFELFGHTWALILEPGYVFTFNGLKGLLASERVKQALDQARIAGLQQCGVQRHVVLALGSFNGRVRDFHSGTRSSVVRTFAGGNPCAFTIICGFAVPRHFEGKVPTVVVTDSSFLEDQDSDLADAEVDEELVNELAELAETTRIEAERKIMPVQIDLRQLGGPLLEFGGPGEFSDVRQGLQEAGPFDLRFGAGRNETITVGLVGPDDMIGATQRLGVQGH